MAVTLYVATRKGLFTFVRGKNKRYTIKQIDFLGDPVTMILPDARNGMLYAALNLGHFGHKLHRARGGKRWKECAAPAFPAAEATGQKTDSVKQVWSLETGGHREKGTLWAGTIPGGLFRSDDGGDSWQLIESLWNHPKRKEWNGGGYDQPGIHSICVDPRDAKRVAVAVSTGGVWVTTDAGTSWACRAQGMRAAYMPPELAYEPNAQDAHRMVQSPSNPEVYWVQHHNGIFRSTDGAASWHEIKNVKPSVFGFAVAVHPRDPDIAWFVPGVKDECRVPVDGKLVVTRTRDGGKHFKSLGKGLPQKHCYDLVYRHGLAIDDTGNRLAFGSTTGGLWVSENQGDAWENVSLTLPPVYAVRFDHA